MNRRRILATSAAVALAGCVSYPGRDDTPSAEVLVANAIERRRELTDLSARRVVDLETPEESIARTERVACRPPADQRIEVVDSTDPGVPAGSVTVTNRTRTWEYNPETELVDVQNHPTKVDSDRTLDVLEALRDEYRLGYAGTEPVDGHETHLVETRPPVEDVDGTIELVVGDTTYAIPLSGDDLEDLDVRRSVWIDDERRYPVRERTEITDENKDADEGGNGTRYALTVTYEDLELDAGLDSERFTYQPPPEATVVTDGPEPDGVFESPTAAAEESPYAIPDPTVPDEYVLDRITVVDQGEAFGTTTTLWYDDPTVVARELYVRVREERRFETGPLEALADDVDGRTAYYRDGRLQSVFWDCGDLNYEVSSLVEGDPLAEIAASIGCPPASRT